MTSRIQVFRMRGGDRPTWLVIALYFSFLSAGFCAPVHKAAKKTARSQTYGGPSPSGADQVLTSIYDGSTNTIRVEGGASASGGTVTSVGLSMPSTFSVSGTPVTSAGTLSVTWAQPVAVANGGTGQTTAASAFNALAPPTSAGGLIYGTGLNTYGNLAIGSSGQCLGSNGVTAVWNTCGTGTVTSVGLALPAGFTAGGSPVTTNGTLAVSMPSGWTAGSLLVGNGSNSVATLAPGAAGQCLTSSGTTITWGGCGLSGASTTVQVNGANTSLQTPINFQSGAYITVTNPSAGNVQFNFSGPLAAVNGGTGLTAVGSNGQCLGTNGSVMQWQACGGGSAITLQTNGAVNSSQTALNLANGTNITFSNTTGGTVAASVTGTLAASAIPAINLGSSGNGGVSGTLGVGNGGTGLTAVGSNGQCLGTNGSVMQWQACGGGSAITLQTNGAVNSSQTALNLANGTNVTFSNTTGGTVIASVTGTLAASAVPAINLGSSGNGGVSGTLGVGNGGTGLTVVGSNGQCLGTNGSVMQWQACGGSAITLQTNGANNGSQTLLNLVAGTNITLANSGGNVTVSAASGSLPASWSVAGTTNTVSAQPASGQDATTLILAPALATGGMKDILDVCDTTACAKKYFGVTFNGNLTFDASNLQLATTGAAPYLYLNGSGGVPAQPYVKSATAELSAASCAASTAATGGTIAAGTYWFECTYVNSVGETQYSSPQSVTTTGSTSTITVTAPGAEVSGFGYQVYYNTSSTQSGFQLVKPTSSNCTLASQTFSGNSVCVPTSNTTYTAPITTTAVSPPSTNGTGGAYLDAWQASGEGVALCLASSSSASDCVVGGGVTLQGGTGLNLVSGTVTTANTLACFSGSETASQCAANAANDVIGVFNASGQNALVQTGGIATVSLAAAATTTYNHFACTNATAGTIIDSASACASGQQVGLIAQTNGSNVTSVPVFLTVQGAGGGGGGISVVYSTKASATAAAIATTTMLTPSANHIYMLSFQVSQTAIDTACTANPAANIQIGYKDSVSGATVSGYYLLRTSDSDGNSGTANADFKFGGSQSLPYLAQYGALMMNAASGTAITYQVNFSNGTGCGSATAYTVIPILEQIQ